MTITGVTRDDLLDGAAWLYAETCRLIHGFNPAYVLASSSSMTSAARTPRSIWSSTPARRCSRTTTEIAAHLQEDSPRLQLRPLARDDQARPRRWHTAEPDSGRGRDAREEISAAMRPACVGLRPADHVVPASLSPPPDRPLVHQRSSSSWQRGRGGAGLRRRQRCRSPRAFLVPRACCGLQGMRARGFEIPSSCAIHRQFRFDAAGGRSRRS